MTKSTGLVPFLLCLFVCSSFLSISYSIKDSRKEGTVWERRACLLQGQAGYGVALSSPVLLKKVLAGGTETNRASQAEVSGQRH